ncbi:MAG: hypothetical protein K6T83_16475 [Alicyclobacillus sp.]|nr:hypothetical protein [Alicyclobacillus sp.]
MRPLWRRTANLGALHHPYWPSLMKRRGTTTAAATALTGILLSGLHLPCNAAYGGVSATAASNPLPATLTLSTARGFVGTQLAFTVKGLEPNQRVQLLWSTETGSYRLDGTYQFDEPVYKDVRQLLLSGTSDSGGTWNGEFRIPKGFGGNHTLIVSQSGKEVTQANVYVSPSFWMSPSSGPVGTPITIHVEGLGATEMDSNWQLTYDNKMTGLISAVSQNGSAVVKLRAAGPVGPHTITIWHGYMGMPYVNYSQAPTSYLPVPTFTFRVTGGRSVQTNYVEPTPPDPAGGGVKMPPPHHAPGVSISLSRTSGTVGQPITLTATGLPATRKVTLVWNSMSGSRVSGNGFTPVHNVLGTAFTDATGHLTYHFAVPDDLGGIPHRLDVDVSGKTVGQAYLRILPSVAQVTPASGPAGTVIHVELKGVGWTEFDNTYYITYDNAYMGYVCGFNSSGTVRFSLVASGDTGYHIIDLYPGIYRGKKPEPNIYNAPQLTYYDDHPGDALPAIRLGFEITKR